MRRLLAPGGGLARNQNSPRDGLNGYNKGAAAALTGIKTYRLRCTAAEINMMHFETNRQFLYQNRLLAVSLTVWV
jgi:hypothetical protein